MISANPCALSHSTQSLLSECCDYETKHDVIIVRRLMEGPNGLT